MKHFIKTCRVLSVFPVYLACIALMILMVMTFCDVILRSAFNNPIEAATELTRILMAIMVFSVMPIISAQNKHISVDLTDGLFHRFRLTRLRNGLIFFLTGIMLLWPMQQVWKLAERARDYGDVTEYLAMPQYIIGWFIAIATGITAISMAIVGLVHLFAPHALEKQQ